MGGLDDLIGAEVSEAETRFGTYPSHPDDEKIEGMMDDLQERFPEDVQCDLVEIAPNWNHRYNGRAYWRERDGTQFQYVRFNKEFIESAPDWRIRQTVLHEMCHLYMYQKGYKDHGDTTPIFRWLCGAVGAKINNYNPETSETWEEIAEPFIEEGLKKW